MSLSRRVEKGWTMHQNNQLASLTRHRFAPEECYVRLVDDPLFELLPATDRHGTPLECDLSALHCYKHDAPLEQRNFTKGFCEIA